jgi:hypothetical protein
MPFASKDRASLGVFTVMVVMGYFLNCKQSRQFRNLMNHGVTHYRVVTLLKSNFSLQEPVVAGI